MVKIATIRAVAELQMGCATARSRVVRVGTLGLHYLEWGSADHPPLLFLHGSSAHAHWFDAVAPSFADRYHVVSLDQRGHCEREWARPATYATEDPRLLAHLATMGVVARDGGWVYRFDPEANRSRQPTDTLSLLDRITAPALVVRGELSPVLSRALADRVVTTIRGARLVEIPGTYHLLLLDAPAALVAVLAALLSLLRSF